MTAPELEALNRQVSEADAKAAKGRAAFTSDVVLPGIVLNLQELLATCDPDDYADLNSAANMILWAQSHLHRVAARPLSMRAR